jgi:hypothetical protein
LQASQDAQQTSKPRRKRGRPHQHGDQPDGSCSEVPLILKGYDEAKSRGEKHTSEIQAVIDQRSCSISEDESVRHRGNTRPSHSIGFTSNPLSSSNSQNFLTTMTAS